MKRTFMSFIAFVLAILLSANYVFAQNTATLPYTDDFSSNSGWTFVNADDNYYNSWDIVSGRLFVYHGFGDYTNSTYSTSDCATSYAYRNIQLGTSDSIRIQFDITVGGERSTSGTYYDYAAVLFAPANANNTFTGSTSCSNPSGLGSTFVVFGPMAKLTMVHKDTTIVNPRVHGSSFNIAFLWHNDGSGGDGISATINNLSITEVNAPEPLPEVNMSKYITLTVTQGDSIDIGVKASANNTPVKIKSGSWDTTLTVGYYSYTSKKYKSQSSTMTIYGNVEEFYCNGNGSKITVLDASHNTSLMYLYCSYNQLTSLDVSGLTELKELNCVENQLTSLDVSGLANLEELYCYNNQLTSLDIEGCTSLGDLECDNNQLTSLDVSELTNLYYLDCYTNQLTSLDVSELTNLQYIGCEDNNLTNLNVSGCNNLEYIDCYGNQMSTQAIDNLYCQLPDRISEGVLVVSLSATDEIILATNKTNATDKNWTVAYYNEEEDNRVHFPATNGTYVCGEESSALANIEEQTINLYPNPAKDEVVLKGIKGERVTIFDTKGRILKQEVINERLDIRDLQSGVYYLQVKDITTKLIKQ